MRFFYYTLLAILLPAFLLVATIRAWRQTGNADSTLERLGYVRRSPAGPVLCVHASSIGEMQAAVPLVRRLQSDYPDAHIVVTSFTASGMARARAAFGETVQVCALPYDFPAFARRFLNRIRPLALIVMETEIWPSLFRIAGERRIPVLLASARVTERSARRYARLGRVLDDALSHVQLVAAQSEADAERFINLGMPRSRVHLCGNLKFDIPESAETVEQGQALRRLVFGDAPVLIAASTRVGEDKQILEAFDLVRTEEPAARLIIVPRHPERGPSILAHATGHDYSAELRSRSAEPGGVDVYIVDTIGELNAFYAAADAAFVGGSLVDAGGHNLLEPASIGLPVLTGPFHTSSPDIFATMRNDGAILVVEDGAALGRAWLELLRDPVRRDDLAQRGRAIVASNRGALARLAELLEPYLQGAR